MAHKKRANVLNHQLVTIFAIPVKAKNFECTFRHYVGQPVCKRNCPTKPENDGGAHLQARKGEMRIAYICVP